jgi:hypothetical protein
MADRFDEAVDLYAFAYAFAVFDTKRVSDRSAHQAIGALQLAYMSTPPEERKRAFAEFYERASTPGSPSALRICGELRRVGRPSTSRAT